MPSVPWGRRNPSVIVDPTTDPTKAVTPGFDRSNPLPGNRGTADPIASALTNAATSGTTGGAWQYTHPGQPVPGTTPPPLPVAPAVTSSTGWTTASGAPATPAGTPGWWNAADPQGSIGRLLQGRAPTSQTLESLGPQLQSMGIQLSPANAEGITSKINIPGVGWVRVLDGGVAGGQGTGWTYVPQGDGSSSGDASSGSAGNSVYVNEILSRLAQLHNPANDPNNDPLKPLYDLMGLNRIQSLSGAPYTGAQDAALTAQYMAPLAQARDAALLQNKEQAGAHGYLPTSGLLTAQNNTVQQGYERAVAGGANNLAVQAIAEKQRRAQEQLSVLASLLNAHQTSRTESNQFGQSAVDTAGLLSNLDQGTLQSLLAAGGGSGDPNQLLSMLTNLTQNQTNQNTAAGQNSAAMWGQILAQIIGSLGGTPTTGHP